MHSQTRAARRAAVVAAARARASGRRCRPAPNVLSSLEPAAPAGHAECRRACRSTRAAAKRAKSPSRSAHRDVGRSRACAGAAALRAVEPRRSSRSRGHSLSARACSRRRLLAARGGGARPAGAPDRARLSARVVAVSARRARAPYPAADLRVTYDPVRALVDGEPRIARGAREAAAARRHGNAAAARGGRDGSDEARTASFGCLACKGVAFVGRLAPANACVRRHISRICESAVVRLSLGAHWTLEGPRVGRRCEGGTARERRAVRRRAAGMVAALCAA